MPSTVVPLHQHLREVLSTLTLSDWFQLCCQVVQGMLLCHRIFVWKEIGPLFSALQMKEALLGSAAT